ncbi:hypothetical protein Patl1_25768 [Pistacia atlantica]|uniref:Uncharacterized protein n=1 Tax=Pistacia atlantica TaxID=434234 RepID=A0ACC1B333_9ROSI|nr:hypothetical protein Patl1_25768 [Pistacia atlantica]
MGSFPSKKKSEYLREQDHHVGRLTEKIRHLREEIKEMMNEREKESRAYEREVMLFALKEGEWRQERKRLREEVKRLKKCVEEKEEKIRVTEEDGVVVVVGEKEKNSSEKEWELLGTSFFLEQMREERARRDEAVEKWKQLYLTIKTELDDLVQRTHGDGLYWKAEEEDMIKELRRELKEKQENTEALKAQLASAEREVHKREREIDILRQSFRIMSCNKKAAAAAAARGVSKSVSKSFALVKQIDEKSK